MCPARLLPLIPVYTPLAKGEGDWGSDEAGEVRGRVGARS
jgi:hypothetical protein